MNHLKDHFEENIESIIEFKTIEDLESIRSYLIEENEKLLENKKNLKALYEEFYQKKTEYEQEEEARMQKIENATLFLNNEKKLFEKKLQILQNAYQQLDIDRKAVEREKKAYHMNKEYDADSSVIQYISIHSFFKGVDNVLALKKRYKDLIKIFHPDNLCGDNDTVQMINQEYNALKEKYQC